MYEEAIAQMHISAPAERNPRLATFLEAVNADLQLKAWWHAQQVNAPSGSGCPTTRGSTSRR